MRKYDARLMPLLIVVFTLTTAVLLSAEETIETLSVPVGWITIEPPADYEQQRSSVSFPHYKHFDYTCKSCHHTWEGNTKIKNCKTSGCHDLTAAPTRSEQSSALGPESIRYFKYAYHEQCIDCHKNIKIQNKELAESKKKIEGTLPDSGPTSCIVCHPRDN